MDVAGTHTHTHTLSQLSELRDRSVALSSDNSTLWAQLDVYSNALSELQRAAEEGWAPSSTGGSTLLSPWPSADPGAAGPHRQLQACAAAAAAAAAPAPAAGAACARGQPFQQCQQRGFSFGPAAQRHRLGSGGRAPGAAAWQQQQPEELEGLSGAPCSALYLQAEYGWQVCLLSITGKRAQDLVLPKSVELEMTERVCCSEIEPTSCACLGLGVQRA
eukprot:scaffold60653_cov14-Tisochrysis_lutea.AAC.2